MPDLTSLLAFAAIALGMALTPGPNMICLIALAGVAMALLAVVLAPVLRIAPAKATRKG